MTCYVIVDDDAMVATSYGFDEYMSFYRRHFFVSTSTMTCNDDGVFLFASFLLIYLLLPVVRAI